MFGSGATIMTNYDIVFFQNIRTLKMSKQLAKFFLFKKLDFVAYYKKKHLGTTLEL